MSNDPPTRQPQPPQGARARRFAMLGWARLAVREREGSGMNLVAAALARELASRGHTVLYLRSGMDYSLRPGMWIEHRETWNGVECHDLFNSPNLAPGNFNLHHPARQAAAPEHAALVTRWALSHRVELAFIQSFEGFGFDLVGTLKKAGVRVAVTPHNYFALCPQVDLLRDESGVCEDFEGGRACASCLWHAPPPAAHVSWRRRYQTAERLFGPHALARMKARLRHAADACRALFSTRAPLVLHDEPAGPQAAPLPQTHSPLPIAREGCVERLIENRGGDATAPGPHAARRRAGVAALSAADVVLCPGRTLMQIHAAMGVNPAVLRLTPISAPHFDDLRAAAEAAPWFNGPPWTPHTHGPLRLGYFGNCFPNKGLATLIAAIELLSPHAAARTHFVIRASGDDAPFRRRMAGRANVSFLGGYSPGQIAAAQREFDVCIFPNMGLENAPLVVLESLCAGKFLIASNLGATPEWVRHGENGLLFPAGDSRALAAAVESIVSGTAPLASPARVQQTSPVRTFQEYVQDVEGALLGVLGGAEPRATG
ncbi:MAG: glycosyltransferase [Phycisphaeraceae bacterium]|nr:glycosyltransferase [Phycisphaeraceae bacterium]